MIASLVVALFFVRFQKSFTCNDVSDRVNTNYDSASEVKAYFKMQYITEGYSLKNVVPGGFIPAYLSICLHLDKVRKIFETL